MGRCSCTQNIVLYNVHVDITFIYHLSSKNIHPCSLQIASLGQCPFLLANGDYSVVDCNMWRLPSLNHQQSSLWVVSHGPPLSRLPGKSMTHSWTFLGTRCKQHQPPRLDVMCALKPYMTNRTPQAKLTSSTFATRAFHLILPEYSIIKL